MAYHHPIGYESIILHLDVKLWIHNLLDDDKPIYAQQFGSDFNSQLTVSSVVNPSLRQIGVTATYRF